RREAGEGCAPWARGAPDAAAGRTPSRIPSPAERRTRQMKKLVLTLLLAATLPLAAQRGPGGPPPGGPNGGGPGGPPAAGPQQPPDEVLKDVLGLTDAQLAQLHTLLDSRRTAAEAL